MDEFELIDRYFKPLGAGERAAGLGIGDDCAVLDVAPNEQLLVTVDTQVESVHFPVQSDPEDIGYRSCATSLSDIAAMGGTARWATLALTLPRDDGDWVERFAHGAAASLRPAGALLVGGDTTRGPLTISWTIFGGVPRGEGLRRDGAADGDAVYVSGTLGGACAALDLLDVSLNSKVPDADDRAILASYWRPQPRLQLGRELRGLASSCIDVSDGLLADFTHVARASGCGGELEFDRLPLLPALVNRSGEARARAFAINGGDDYELCFTVPPDREAELLARIKGLDVSVTRIGRMTADREVRVVDRAGTPLTITSSGYRHFG